VKYQQWRRFFFWKPRRKFKVDINDAGIDVINTWVDEIPISGQRRLGMGEKEKKISLLLSYIRPQFLPGCPLTGFYSTEQPFVSSFLPLIGYRDILYFYRWIPKLKLYIYPLQIVATRIPLVVICLIKQSAIRFS
jgi:hypothetical protein